MAGVIAIIGHCMSALGHKQTCAVQNGMSALPPKADMCSALVMSALCQKRTSSASFDHLVGTSEKHRRHGNAERTGCPEIEHELKA